MFSPPSIGQAEIDEVVATLGTPWITTGPKTKEFERRFADLLGVPMALAVSSCTDAMQLGLAALGVDRGDAVFTSTLTFAATANVADHLGATPVLCDIDPETLNLSPVELERQIQRVLAEGRLRPRAIMPVHFAGHPCEMDAILDIAKRYGLAVVEDAAHALPAAFNGEMVGSAGDGSVQRLAAFSFYATKNLATAEGGMLTGTPELVEEARLWSLHGMNRDAWKRYDKGGSWRYDIVRPGFKCNLTDIASSLGLHQLERLAGFQDRRRKVVECYDRAFADLPVQIPARRSEVDHAWHLYVLRLNLDELSIDRDRFIDELTERNIGTSVHFIPLHTFTWYRETFGYQPSDFPVALAEFERLVSLPLHPGLTDEDVGDVIEAVTEVLEAAGQ
jgi:dTDP-4-amino-4,6-dideoxygalactose transaminase